MIPEHPPGVTCDPQCALNDAAGGAQKRLMRWPIIRRGGDGDGDGDGYLRGEYEGVIITLTRENLGRIFDTSNLTEGNTKVSSEAFVPLHDGWVSRMDDANVELLRAYKTKDVAAATLNLIEASDRIDPSGMRVAIEGAKTAGVPEATVAAAEASLAELEEEISAFIRHRRRGESLLAAPKHGWKSAGRHIWLSLIHI